jgi:hypothetical protein
LTIGKLPILGARLQRSNPLFERRLAKEQPLESGPPIARNSEGSKAPGLTAISESLRRMPVVKALGSGELKIPTSGISMPACSACRRTVSSSHC